MFVKTSVSQCRSHFDVDYINIVIDTEFEDPCFGEHLQLDIVFLQQIHTHVLSL